MQTSWAIVDTRSKLRSKVKFFNFVPNSRLNTFVRQRQNTAKNVGSGKQTIPPSNKINKRVWAPVGLVFLIIF